MSLSEIRVNTTKTRTGVGTITYTETGPVITGIATASNFKTGSTNVHSTGVELANINTGGSTATFGGPISGTTASFSGTVSIGGTLTYEDVTNIDSVGIITARSTVSIGDSINHIGDTDTAIRFPSANTITAETGGTERLRIDSSGRVGIGEDNPTRNLHIDGTAHQSGIIIHTAGNHSTAIDMDSNRSSAAGGLAELNFKWNGTTVGQIGAYAGADTTNKDDGHIHFGTASAGSIVERMRIQSTGIVKVETNDSSSFNAHFLVNNSESNSGVSLIGSGSSFSAGGWAAVTDAGIIRSSANSSNGLVLQAASGDMRFYVGGNPPDERLRISSSGRVLVGHTAAIGDLHGPQGTTNRNPFIQIHGANTSSAGAALISWKNSAGAYYAPTLFLAHSGSDTKGTNAVIPANGEFGSIVFSGDDGTDFVKGAMIKARLDGTPGDNDMPGRLQFLTTPDGAQEPEERLRIDSSGRVLIGTTTVGSGTADDLTIGNSSDHGGITIRTPNNKWASIHFADGTSGGEQYRGQVSYDHSNDWMRFYVAEGERLRIKSTGEVHMGTSSPTTSNSAADDLVLGNTSGGVNRGMTIWSHSSQNGCIAFADNDANFAGSLQYLHNGDYLRFLSGGSERARIYGDSNTCNLKLYNQANTDASATCEIQANHDIRDSSKIVFGRENANDWSASWASQHSFLAFHTFNGSSNLGERLRIKSNGDIQLQGGVIYGDDSALPTFTIANTSGNSNNCKINLGENVGSDNGGIAFYTAGSSSSDLKMRIRGNNDFIDIIDDNRLRFHDGKLYIYHNGSNGYVVNGTGQLLYRSDTHTFESADGSTERLRIDSNGYVTKPNHVAFFAYANMSWTNLNGGDKVQFDTLVSGSWGNNNVNSNGYDTSNDRFVAPVAGLYHFTVAMYINSNNMSNILSIVPRIDGSQLSNGNDTVFFWSARQNSSNTADGNTWSGSIQLYLNKDQYVEVYRRTGGSGTHQYYGRHSHFFGHLIG